MNRIIFLFLLLQIHKTKKNIYKYFLDAKFQINRWNENEIKTHETTNSPTNWPSGSEIHRIKKYVRVYEWSKYHTTTTNQKTKKFNKEKSKEKQLAQTISTDGILRENCIRNSTHKKIKKKNKIAQKNIASRLTLCTRESAYTILWYNAHTICFLFDIHSVNIRKLKTELYRSYSSV